MSQTAAVHTPPVIVGQGLWVINAACAGDPDPERWHLKCVDSPVPDALKAACARCPVRDACLADGLDHPISQDTSVRAGLNVQQRDVIRDRRAKAAEAPYGGRAHGRYHTYGRGCRCEPCTTAKREYGRAYRARRRAS